MFVHKMSAKHKLKIFLILAIIIEECLSKSVKQEDKDDEHLNNSIDYDMEDSDQDGQKLVPFSDSLIKVMGPNQTAQSAMIIVPANYSEEKEQQLNKNGTKKQLGHNYGEGFIYFIEQFYEWARAKHPLLELILKIGKVLTKDKIEQMPTTKMVLDILETGVTWEIEQAKEQFLNTYSNFTISQMIKEIQKHCNLSQERLLSQELIEELMNLPGANSLVESAMIVDVNGTPFAFALMDLLEHLNDGVTMAQLNEGKIIPDIYKNVTQVISPFVEFQMNKYMLKIRDELHMVIDNLTNIEQIQAEVNKVATKGFKRAAEYLKIPLNKV